MTRELAAGPARDASLTDGSPSTSRLPALMLWSLLTVVAFTFFSRGFVDALMPGEREIYDFYQEWSSARNVREGLPVYSSVEKTLPRYLGIQLSPGGEMTWNVNVHPPTSVLLALPFSYLEYRPAFLAWNLCALGCLGASLWIVLRRLWGPLQPMALLPVRSHQIRFGPRIIHSRSKAVSALLDAR